jgi:hypothetical protein
MEILWICAIVKNTAEIYSYEILQAVKQWNKAGFRKGTHARIDPFITAYVILIFFIILLFLQTCNIRLFTPKVDRLYWSISLTCSIFFQCSVQHIRVDVDYLEVSPEMLMLFSILFLFFLVSLTLTTLSEHHVSGWAS